MIHPLTDRTITSIKPTPHNYNLLIVILNEDKLTDITFETLTPPVTVVTDKEDQLYAENPRA